MTRALEEAESDAQRVRALGRNHSLWSILIKDLALQGNKLPEALKSNLIALGLWSMRYSTAAILQKLPVQPLINVNRNVAAGIAEQRSAIVQAAKISAATTA